MIDLHLHLDGALTKEDIEFLADLQKIKLPEGYQDHICVSSLCTSLNDYLRCFQIPSLVTQTKEALYEETKRILKRMADQGLVYVELRFAPQLQTAHGMSQEEAVLAVIKAEKEMRPLIMSGLILCFMRHSLNSEFNYETIRVAKKYFHKGVSAVDLAGAEGLYPTEEFKPIFDMSNDDGLPSTIHAGEADGPASVEAALAFNATRIGHGVRSIYDEKVVKELADRQIPLELCPTSEIQTKAVPGPDAMPLRKLMEAGCLITINTDDPAISQIDLANEYRLIRKYCSVTKEESLKFMLNAAEAAFCTYDDKVKIRAKIERGFDDWYKTHVENAA
jgi:adenosine deaminase